MSFRNHINLDRVALTLFIAAIAAIVFSYGAAVVHFRIFPFQHLQNIVTAVEALSSRPHQLFPIRYNRVGPTIYDDQAIAPGVTLLTSYWPEINWMPGLKLIDSEGNTLHLWPIDARGLYPQSPHMDSRAGSKNRKNNFVHGSYLFPNGDVLFNVEYLGLFRVDACGETVWKLPYRTHHSIALDEEGNAWVSGLTWVEASSEAATTFPGLRAPFARETALKISPDGQILVEIDLLDALYNSDLRYLFFRHGRGATVDITHLNDVEALSEEMAIHFPMFDPGDLLVSFRNLNLIAVLGQNGTIKWSFSDKLKGHHDPDFEDSGMIVTFNNRRDSSETGTILGGTKIIAINPVDGSVKNLYPKDGSDDHFYTATGGKHQLLSNGNRLITEATTGRVLEVDDSGRLVWEWVHEPYSSDYVPEVLEATRYEYSVDQVSNWSCNERP